MGKYQKNIEAARRITVMQYLETYHPGELVRKTDREYCTRTHDSLIITPANGFFHWFSRNVGGNNAIDYAKQYGVLFASIKDKGAQGEKIDIMFKAEDVSKLNRIYEQLGYTVPKKISADRKNAETRRQMPDPMLTRGKTMEDIDPRPSFKTVAAQLRKAAARSAERAVNATRKEER